MNMNLLRMKNIFMNFFADIVILTYVITYYLLRSQVNFDEINNRFTNLSNCYYSAVFNTMIVYCYKMLRFVISSNKDKLYGRNCFETFLEHNSRLCVFCANNLFFILGRMNEFNLRDCC